MIYNVPPLCKKMLQLFDGSDAFVDGYSTKFKTQRTLEEQPFICKAGTGYMQYGLRNYDGHIGVNMYSAHDIGYQYAPYDANFYLTEPINTTRFSKVEFNIVGTTDLEDMDRLDNADGIYIVLFRTTEKWIYDESNVILMQHVPLYQTTEGRYNDTPFPLEKIVVDVSGINETVYIGFIQYNNNNVLDLYHSVYLGVINAF